MGTLRTGLVLQVSDSLRLNDELLYTREVGTWDCSIVGGIIFEAFCLLNVQTEPCLPKNPSKCCCEGYIVLLYSLTYCIIVVICDCWMGQGLQIASHLNASKTELQYSYT